MEDAEFAEVDLFLLVLVAQITRHQRQAESEDADWVSLSTLEALCQRIGQLGAAAIEHGWHDAAARRALVEVRSAPNGPQVRLEPAAVERLGIGR